MALQIASGILIAATILAVILSGVGLALAALRSHQGQPIFGCLLAAAGIGAAVFVIVAAT